MYTIRIENECSCFKKSAWKNNLKYENKADSSMKTKIMECLLENMIKFIASIGNTKSYLCNTSGLFILTLQKLRYSICSEETSHLN